MSHTPTPRDSSDVVLSVALPTHNPNPARLTRTLAGLRAQTLTTAAWELVIIDNASSDRAAFAATNLGWHPRARVVREERLGLTAARLRGFAETTGELIVLVDDDNVLAADYLAQVTMRFAADATLGAAGGKSRPEFESPPPEWAREFDGLLALRDLGPTVQRSSWPAGAAREYPACAPIGAGMALRRTAAAAYAKALAGDPRRAAFDRTGSQLVSGGDNDLIMTMLEAGLGVAYFPQLSLTHLIPARRIERTYLGALNRAIARSWVRVLALHGIRPWPPVGGASVPLRALRAWFRTRAWRGPAEWVRWQGRRGQFEGQADLRSPSA